MTKNLSRKKPIMFCAVVLLLIMPLFYTISLKNPFAIGQNGYYIFTAIVELFFALCVIIICKISAIHINFFHTEKYSFRKGIYMGSFMLVYCIGSFLIGIQSYGADNMILPSAVSMLSLLAMMLSVGIFEEILCRGLLLNTLLLKWKQKRYGIYAAVILSSAIFGSMHFINLFVRPTLVFFTVAQVIYTTMAGTFFAAVYLRSKNILPVILYHALHDISTGIFYILIPTEKLANMNVHYAASADQSVSQGLFFIIASIPLFIAALLLLRKVGGHHSKVL